MKIPYLLLSLGLRRPICIMVMLLPALAPAEGVPREGVRSSLATGGYVLNGVVQAVKQNTVAARASGRIVNFSGRAGDKVQAGQVLATIDDREAQVGVQRAQAQTAPAEADVRNAKAQMERTRDLHALAYVSEAALDIANTQYQATQARRDQASAGIQQSAIAQVFTRVTAPMSGSVLQTFAQAGDLAVSGTPLLVVYAPQPLRAVVQVPASGRLTVLQAQQASVLVGSSSNTGQSIVPLNRLEVPSTDPVSQTTEWRMDLPAKESASLMPGQQVQVRFSGNATPSSSHVLVPASAVIRRNELSAVYVVEGQHFALRAVLLGCNRTSASLSTRRCSSLQVSNA
jgi:RND family efflux transporter MFP subunit